MLTATIDALQIPLAASFNVGDVVTLKDGGSRMTVTYAGPVALNPGDWLICEWFDEHGELRREMFAPAQRTCRAALHSRRLRAMEPGGAPGGLSAGG
ncbi:uncharacterized protein YodC (DUF2158 family) [Paraburkholderia bryophila]|uniref:Uncharacterized protein YodC (DUF2158 family) n=1 Tax=Paraburkholderia bryophila TaxID=420952 RepID=A0A7Z0B0F6_9BURK|nr:uncharacterized protein YodC (DUF2158 family) [Paraburkholderia bryophila]